MCGAASTLPAGSRAKRLFERRVDRSAFFFECVRGLDGRVVVRAEVFDDSKTIGTERSESAQGG